MSAGEDATSALSRSPARLDSSLSFAYEARVYARTRTHRACATARPFVTTKEYARAEPTITTGAIRKLEAYAWPGNVRELENVMERALIVSTGDKLRIEGLESSLPATGRPTQKILTEQEFRAAEVQNLIACLKQTGGRVAGPGGAADLLGIRQTTLYSRIRKLNLTPQMWAEEAG